MAPGWRGHADGVCAYVVARYAQYILFRFICTYQALTKNHALPLLRSTRCKFARWTRHFTRRHNVLTTHHTQYSITTSPRSLVINHSSHARVKHPRTHTQRDTPALFQGPPARQPPQMQTQNKTSTVRRKRCMHQDLSPDPTSIPPPSRRIRTPRVFSCPSDSSV